MSYTDAFKNRMRLLIDRHTLANMSERTGLSKTSIHRYATAGDDSSPMLSNIDLIEKEMDLPKGWLLGFTKDEEINTTIDIYSNWATLLAAEDTKPETSMMISTQFALGANIAVRVNMNSMEPFVRQGDILLLAKMSDDQPITPGIYITQVGNALLFGRIISGDGQLNIISDNSDYPIIKVKTSKANIMFHVSAIFRAT